MKISPIVVVVVGRLTLEEQRLISYITDNYPKKKIIVIHNYMELRSIQDVKAATKEEF